MFSLHTNQTQVANVRRWIDALRSGKYHQTTRVLKDKKGFCCLGVACDLFDPTNWASKESLLCQDEEIKIRGVKYGEGSGEMWPLEVQNSMGICAEATTLTDMNDAGKSFKEIADYIEERINSFLSTRGNYPSSTKESTVESY